MVLLLPFILPLDEAIASRAVFVIVSGSGGRTCFWSLLNNSKTVWDIPRVSMGRSYEPMGGLSNRPIPYPHVRPNQGSKSPPFIFQPTGWRLTKMSAEHILGCIGCLWNDAMNNHTDFAKAPSEWKQIEHNMCCRREAQSPLCCRPWLFSWLPERMRTSARPSDGDINSCKNCDSVGEPWTLF